MKVTETAARNQSATLLPTYSADTFGACSTLFELGGMIVIHDPSGCNSTYTTHDEPRWYDHDSLIFISAMTEYDAILGRDDKLIRDIETAAAEFHPKFICVIPSQIATLISADLPALCRIIASDTQIPTFTLPTNSMQSYELGIQYALAHLAKHVATISHNATKSANSHPHVNILGLTPLDYHWKKALPSLEHFLTAHDFELAASWTLDTTFEAIESSSHADVNLVLTKSALPAAKILEEQCGIPYVVAVPYPPLEQAVAKALRLAIHENDFREKELSPHHEPANTNRTFGPAGCFLRKFLNPQDLLFPEEMPCRLSTSTATSRVAQKNYIIGEPLHTIFLTEALRREINEAFEVLFPPFTELDLTNVLANAHLLLADPLYEALAPSPAHFIPIPHRACSGRTYEKQERNLLDPVEWAALLDELAPYL